MREIDDRANDRFVVAPASKPPYEISVDLDLIDIEGLQASER
nr:hypothetical protein [Marinicella sp. W31]MDC2876072.1 hypothetical protein [Marinicella sp. W31]